MNFNFRDTNLFTSFRIAICISCVVFYLLATRSIAHATPECTSRDRTLSFPRDHGNHPECETEWWYFTGHLNTAENRTFGFELTFFRVSTPSQPLADSKSQGEDRFMAHFAITDDAAQSFQFREKISGVNTKASSDTNKLEVRVGTWQATMNDSTIDLTASDDGMSLHLILTPRTSIILHGKNGLTRKSYAINDVSYYSSFSRLSGKGLLEVNGTKHTITEASAWMDHEMSPPLNLNIRNGWNWFALQFNTHEELMVYQFKDSSGKPTAYSFGTLIDSTGHTTHLNFEQIQISSSGEWKSSVTNISYPTRWHMEIPSLNLIVDISPTVPSQELKTITTNTTYWEGRSTFTGERRGQDISGNAYVEVVPTR